VNKQQLISKLAQKSLKKWRNDTAFVKSKCAFCENCKNECTNCLCPPDLCGILGLSGLFHRIMYGVYSVIISHNGQYAPTMTDIDPTLRQQVIAELEKLVIPKPSTKTKKT
jgi:hypothetical protein